MDKNPCPLLSFDNQSTIHELKAAGRKFDFKQVEIERRINFDFVYCDRLTLSAILFPSTF